MVDAPASGAGAFTGVGVRVPSWAPTIKKIQEVLEVLSEKKARHKARVILFL